MLPGPRIVHGMHFLFSCSHKSLKVCGLGGYSIRLGNPFDQIKLNFLTPGIS